MVYTNTPADDPYEAGLGFCVSLGKGDFIGRDALMKIKADGLGQKLCTMTVKCDECVIYGGEAVLGKGRVVGRVRSGGYGYTVKVTIAFAYLPTELAKAGTKLEIEMFGERVPAEVVPNTLHDPEGLRLRAL